MYSKHSFSGGSVAIVRWKTDSANIYRVAVQHLALFVPWELFLSETSGDINAIWKREKQVLP